LVIICLWVLTVGGRSPLVIVACGLAPVWLIVLLVMSMQPALVKPWPVADYQDRATMGFAGC
jgi:hypothetical protein